MEIGIGLEFARGMGVTFEEAASLAAEAGYRLIEPFVHSSSPLTLNSHLTVDCISDYHHLDAARADREAIEALMRRLGTAFCAFDCHSSLILPQIGSAYVIAGIDLAAELHCPIVMSDEGPVPGDWMALDRAFDVMCLTLERIVSHAQLRGVRFAIELHNALTTQGRFLKQLLERFGPHELGVNFDTGNSFLAGNDPLELLDQIVERVVHVHIKDIPESMLHLRGKVTGTRVGVSAGDGVVDLRGIVAMLKHAQYKGVLSVECDTLDQAVKSRIYLEQLIDTVQPHGLAASANVSETTR